MLTTAWTIINSEDWKLEKQLDNGDRVEVKFIKGKKVFKLLLPEKNIKTYPSNCSILVLPLKLSMLKTQQMEFQKLYKLACLPEFWSDFQIV